ncbi:OsmC family protein [Roseateles violae]|uniref:OsmC family protein n=1 Tax=Roseateles violae TaxID=3058042 RepID=A0ABT8DVJ5_9BURK|nr:OsmC family protein [Pelomonas sp. PFR6]MDN3922314.1 OsmC family protein [Pelomonas sp. PFR6]
MSSSNRFINNAEWVAASSRSACTVAFAKTSVEVDLDAEAGGSGLPTPHELLDGALAACTTLTLQLYIKRKGWAVERLRVEVEHEKTAQGYQMRRRIRYAGTLDAEQQASLLRIAEACPVHKTLSGQIAIVTGSEPL